MAHVLQVRLDRFWHLAHQASSIISLLPSPVLKLQPLITWLALTGCPRSPSQSQFIFTARCFSLPPHRKTIFPECGIRIKRQLPLLLSLPCPHFLLPSQSMPLDNRDRQALKMHKEIWPFLTLRGVMATTSSQEISNSEARNVLHVFLFLFEKKSFRLYAPS